jgi:hypothetical protein
VTTPGMARGRSAYPGFRGTIKLVGTGPRGSRDLTFDEARAAVAGLRGGATTGSQAGGVRVGVGG